MRETQIEIRTHDRIAEIGQAVWDACACPEAADGGRPHDPFTTFRFLVALEDSGSVGPGTGWQPTYLTARLEGEVIACTPLYAKSHSQGEYIFDHNWAHAYENAGGAYYPKLQVAVPFTPATGRRFLCRPGFEEIGLSALVQGAIRLAVNNDLSSLHVTFCTDAEAEAGEKVGLMRRQSQQFHWENNGYADFDGFLADLSSRKRKNIRKERARAQAFGGTIRTLTGDEIAPEHWDAFWVFYQDTGSRKWGTRRHCPRAGRTRWAVCGGGAEFHRARGALWPLLGLYRGSPLPAFRSLLLSSHRFCHSAWVAKGRGRGAGRTQAGARISAGAVPFPALGGGPGFCRCDCTLS